MMIGRVTGHQVGRKNGYDLGFETPPLELVLNFAVDLNFQLFLIFGTQSNISNIKTKSYLKLTKIHLRFYTIYWTSQFLCT